MKKNRSRRQTSVCNPVIVSGLTMVIKGVQPADTLTPKTIAIVYCALGRSWQEIITDFSRPRHESIDQAIIFTTCQFSEWREYQNRHGNEMVNQSIRYNCAFCGAGLGPNGCQNCGQAFLDPEQRGDSFVPLPPKIADLLLQTGHVFAIDPAIVRARVRQQWEEYSRQRCLPS